jgi:two-component system, sensor histidine kinase ChiS
MIHCLLQDRQGFLWAGTKDGLNRFDGYRFTTFRYDPFDTLSISDNVINSILEDRQGRMWVATAKGIDLFDREREIFQHLQTPANGLGLVEDPQGNIWQGGSFGGLTKISLPPDARTLENAKVAFVHLPGAAPTNKALTSPIWDADGRGFVGKISRETYRLRADSLWQDFRVDRDFADLPDARFRAALETADSLNNHFLMRFLPGRDGKIWMSEGLKLFGWNPRTDHCTVLDIPDSLQAGLRPNAEIWHFISNLVEDQRGRLWLGGLSGTFRITFPGGKLLNLGLRDTETSGPLLYGVAGMLEDEGGLIWLGTRGNGLLKYNDNARRFAAGLWQGRSIRTLLKTSDGQIWFSTTGGGLFRLDPARREREEDLAKSVRFFESDIGDVYSLLEDKNGVLWAGSGNWGLVKITGWSRAHGSGRPKFEPLRFEGKNWKGWYAPTKILEDASGKLWLLSPDALRCLDPKSPDSVEKFAFFGEKNPGPFDNNVFPCLFQDQRGRIWIGTGQDGLWRFEAEKRTFKKFKNDRQNPHSISHDMVKSIAEDPAQPERFLWIGTGGGGLNRFDMEAGTFEKFTEKDGLPDLTVYGVQPDAAGYLWLSTNKGLSVFDPKTRIFRNFDQRDGLQNLEFNTLAYSKSADGELLFGGIEGLNAFYPEQMLQANRHVPKVVFTDFKISGKSVSHKTEGSPLDVAIAYAKKIVLPPDAKVISIEFAALDFADPSKNQFSCKMEGFDRDWQSLGTAHSVTYTNLSPGKYTFRVRGSNNDGVWSGTDASLEIEVLAPWWATWWAYSLYFLAFGGVISAFYQLQTKRNQANAEARRLQELNEAKSQFLSTVSHELRTPLTSILGFSKIIKKRLEERILPKTDLSDAKTDRAAEQVLENLSIVVSESERLTALINEVLDLAKIESGKVVWHEEKLEIGELVERAAASTAMLFENKKLKLRLDIALDLPQILGDPDRLLQVLVNLLSNAVKFTERGEVVVSARLVVKNVGRIQNVGRVLNPSDVDVAADTLLIGVADTGIGIPKEFQALVFEKFRQVASDTLTDKPQGTGLGLPICKEIVEHHGGRIWVESTVDEGSAFWFTLPMR